MDRRTFTKGSLAVLIGGSVLELLPQPAAASDPTRPFSDFEASTEGWVGYDILTEAEFQIPTWTAGVDPPPAPTGFVRIVGTSFTSAALVLHLQADFNSLYFRAPQKFRGTSARYGDLLRFHYYAAGRPEVQTRDIYLSGGDLTLRYPVQRDIQSGILMPYTIPLRQGAGWLRLDNGAPATQTDLRQVLADVKDLLIPAAWGLPADASHTAAWLDDVRIVPNGGGRVKVNRRQIDFGVVRVGKLHRIQVVVSNTSKRAGDILRVRIRGPVGPFVTQHDEEEIDIGPKRHLKFLVGFKPSGAGIAGGELILETTDPNFPTVSIPVKGRGRR